jgi:hypothetical protein
MRCFNVTLSPDGLFNEHEAQVFRSLIYTLESRAFQTVTFEFYGKKSQDEKTKNPQQQLKEVPHLFSTLLLNYLVSL